MFQSLRHNSFRRYVFGNVFALNGNWVLRIVMGWLAWDLTGSSAFVGLVAFLVFGPTIISGPIFGVLVDRADLQRAAMLTQTSLGLAIVGLLGVSASGALTPIVLAGFALFVGIITSAHHPVRMSLGPLLVPRDMIPNVIAVASANFNLARMTGPALGGYLISTGGVDATLAVNALLFLPLLVVLPTLKPRGRDAIGPQDQAIFGALRDGLNYARRDGLILSALCFTGLFAIIGRGVQEILPSIADGLFERGATGLGQMTAAGGAGALVAALLLSRKTSNGNGRLPATALLGAGAGLVLVILLASTENWHVALMITAALGLVGTTVGVGLQTQIQMQVDDAYRGRIASLWIMVGVGSAAIGAIGIGGIAEIFGMRATLMAGSAVALVIGIGIIVWFRVWIFGPPVQKDLPPAGE